MTPQYHMLYDNWLRIVLNKKSASLSSELWPQLISTGYERC